MPLRKILIRLLLPPAWRGSRDQAAIGLREFADAELDSAWQSLHAMNAAHDPVLRAALFQHAFEELQHHAVFNELSKNYSAVLPPILALERQPLLQEKARSNPLLSFYAAESVGEGDIAGDFAAYLEAVPFEDVRKAFKLILEDEKGHALYTRSAFSRLAASRREQLVELAKARGGRLYKSWLRISRSMAEMMADVALALIYFMTGFLLKGTCRKRMTMRSDLEKDSPAKSR